MSIDCIQEYLHLLKESFTFTAYTFVPTIDCIERCLHIQSKA